MPPNPFRTGFVALEEDGVVLTVTNHGVSGYRLTYTPASRALEIASRIVGFSPPSAPILLLEGDIKEKRLVIHPLNTTATSDGFLQPKHQQLRTITFEGFSYVGDQELDNIKDALGNLPGSFIRDPFYGLGFRREFSVLLDAILTFKSVTDLRVIWGRVKNAPRADGASYIISNKMLDDVRKSVARLHEHALRHASSEKSAFAYNSLVRPIDPAAYPERRAAYRKNAVVAALGSALQFKTVLSKADEDAVIDATRAAAPKATRAAPSRLLELTREVELVSLEIVVERVKARLAKKLKEQSWQEFLFENAFILRLAFGVPVLMVGGQVSIGGQRHDGGGGKIADFVLRAASTGNLALIEIKTPDTLLLEPRAYRGGVFGPSRELAGATNQILDQRYRLEQEIARLKVNSRQYDIESYAVTGLIIAGRDLTDVDMQKSFELYRNALKSVSVVTFDELLVKLEALLEFLREPVSDPSGKESAKEPTDLKASGLKDKILVLEDDHLDNEDLENEDLEDEGLETEARKGA